ncbi:hypothetical protein ACT7DJ_00010 [Bacillus cereus]
MASQTIAQTVILAIWVSDIFGYVSNGFSYSLSGILKGDVADIEESNWIRS